MAVIFHIDINAFFASAHLITDPSLKGKPVAVASNHRGSVITTASYEARHFGVNSAMPLAHAKRLCPDLVVVDIDFELYNDLSQRFIKIIQSYSPRVEQASIDECYVDVTEAIKHFKRPLDLATAIQNDVQNSLQLPLSIGVGPNKFLAKMASDMHKPKGITVLRIREVATKLWPLPIEAMHGIGKKTVPRLRDLGIQTIGDLAHTDPEKLRAILGINASVYRDRANGYDYASIEPYSQTKSISQSKTYTNAMTDLDEIRHAIMTEVTEMVARLQKQDLLGKTLTFSIRMADYKTAARSLTLDTYVADKSLIFERIMGLYDEFDGQDAITFISVAISNLVARDEFIEQLNIFDDLENPSTDDIIQRLNATLKKDVFKTPQTLLDERSEAKDVS